MKTLHYAVLVLGLIGSQAKAAEHTRGVDPQLPLSGILASDRVLLKFTQDMPNMSVGRSRTGAECILYSVRHEGIDNYVIPGGSHVRYEVIESRLSRSVHREAMGDEPIISHLQRYELTAQEVTSQGSGNQIKIECHQTELENLNDGIVFQPMKSFIVNDLREALGWMPYFLR